MKYRVLKINGRYYPQCKKSWWPFWLYFEENMLSGRSIVSFVTSVKAVNYCLNLIETESKKSEVFWEFKEVK